MIILKTPSTVFGGANTALPKVGAIFLEPYHQGKTRCMVYITCLTDKFGHPEFVKEGKEPVESSRVLGSLSPITIELACDDPDYYNQLHERTKKAILAIDGNEDLSFASKSWVSKLMGK